MLGHYRRGLQEPFVDFSERTFRYASIRRTHRNVKLCLYKVYRLEQLFSKFQLLKLFEIPLLDYDSPLGCLRLTTDMNLLLSVISKVKNSKGNLRSVEIMPAISSLGKYNDEDTIYSQEIMTDEQVRGTFFNRTEGKARRHVTNRV